MYWRGYHQIHFVQDRNIFTYMSIYLSNTREELSLSAWIDMSKYLTVLHHTKYKPSWSSVVPNVARFSKDFRRTEWSPRGQGRPHYFRRFDALYRGNTEYELTWGRWVGLSSILGYPWCVLRRGCRSLSGLLLRNSRNFAGRLQVDARISRVAIFVAHQQLRALRNGLVCPATVHNKHRTTHVILWMLQEYISAFQHPTFTMPGAKREEPRPRPADYMLQITTKQSWSSKFDLRISSFHSINSVFPVGTLPALEEKLFEIWPNSDIITIHSNESLSHFRWADGLKAVKRGCKRRAKSRVSFQPEPRIGYSLVNRESARPTADAVVVLLSFVLLGTMWISVSSCVQRHAHYLIFPFCKYTFIAGVLSVKRQI